MKLYNVKTHGAIGDANTDDTDAFQRAIDAASDESAAARRRAALIPLAFFALAIFIAIVSNLAGCGGMLPDPNAAKFARCELGAVEQRVADGTVLELAAEALATSEYAAAIDKLIEKLGVDSVRCAVQTISDVAGLPQIAAAPSGTRALGKEARPNLAERADAVARAKGWR